MRLRDRVAIITGSGQGIGRAYAHRLAQEGARVVVTDINEDKGRAVAAEIRDGGFPALFVPVDVSDEASCQAMAEAAAREFGTIHVLVNNAAIFSTITMKPFWELSLDEWDRLMAVNVRGVWLASKAVLPYMREQRWGRIINISSSTVLFGRPNYLHYVSSKSALIGMSRAMAREVGDFGITVNTMMPGATMTEVPRETVTPEQRQAIAQQQCIKRVEEPKDLTGTLVFLASDDAAFITGQLINVDGGHSFH